jgi:acetyltransferase-like isoleucine patch superfamily enzyme
MQLGMTMRIQDGPEKSIKIGQDVWLGCNTVVLKRVEIGDGATVAACQMRFGQEYQQKK